MDLFEKLRSLDDAKLMDIVKNYRQYGYDESLRNQAIELLAQRGISLQDLELTGNLHNSNFDRASDLYRAFSRNSMIALLLYGVVIILMFLLPLLATDLPSVRSFLDLKTIITGLYLVFLGLSFYNQQQFYKAIKQDYGAEGALVYLLLGMPFYLLMYFYFSNQMKEKMKDIR